MDIDVKAGKPVPIYFRNESVGFATDIDQATGKLEFELDNSDLAKELKEILEKGTAHDLNTKFSLSPDMKSLVLYVIEDEE